MKTFMSHEYTREKSVLPRKITAKGVRLNPPNKINFVFSSSSTFFREFLSVSRRRIWQEWSKGDGTVNAEASDRPPIHILNMALNVLS